MSPGVAPIRVLIVDDSVVARRMLSQALESDPEISVVGAAANGSIALAKIPQLSPDVVTLDLEMDEMDGLTALRAIGARHPGLPVIMFSSLTERGAAATLDSIAAGARDYVAKPSGASASAGMARIRDELAPKIKALCGRHQVPARPAAPPPAPTPRRPHGPAPVEALAIGVSTGGPVALGEVLANLPRTLSVPVVIVQHMPPLFTTLLAERLTARGPLRVSEAEDGMEVRPGEAILARGDHHLTIERVAGVVRARLNQGALENSCRPAVDVLFRSVVAVYGSGTLAVVMTGMGQDGLLGCERVREAGGQILVQDEATSVVWGMPGHVAAAGLADGILPLGALAGEIARLVEQRSSSARVVS